MSWKAGVPISEEMRHITAPTLIVTRFFGLLPMRVHRNGKRIYFEPSLFYLIYSFTFGVTIISLTYVGIMGDLSAEKEKSIRIKTRTDLFVTVVDVTVVELVAVCGIFLTPFKYPSFRKFIQSLNDVDAIIPATGVNSARNKSIFVMCTLLGATFIIFTLDTLMYFSTAGERTGRMFIFKCYTSFYVTYFIMMADQYLFWFFVRSILRRTKSLNSFLEMENFKRLLKTGIFEDSKESSKLRLENLKLFNVNRRNASKINNRGTKHNPIFKLIQVYIKLANAVKYLNDLFGLTCAVTLVGILFHLIESPYWFIIELIGNRKDLKFISMMAGWCFIHIGRLTLLAHPCYACQLEAQRTNDLLCKLIGCTDINQQYRSQLTEFSITLYHRKFEFNAGGLTIMDLSLITSISGAIATYLVILVQFATTGNTTTTTEVHLDQNFTINQIL